MMKPDPDEPGGGTGISYGYGTPRGSVQGQKDEAGFDWLSLIGFLLKFLGKGMGGGGGQQQAPQISVPPLQIDLPESPQRTSPDLAAMLFSQEPQQEGTVDPELLRRLYQAIMEKGA